MVRRGKAMLIYSYDMVLVLASVAISMMAAFTGLMLTRGLSQVPENLRQMRIVMAAIALGGGIWSMHFVAMLAMRFDVAVYYETLPTVASILIAILLAGLSLLLMHFGARSRGKRVAAGVVLGLGIAVMHYVGLSGIAGCLPVYDPVGFFVAGGLAALMGIASIEVAYGTRNARSMLTATVIFGSSVVAVHFTAMYWTTFATAAAPIFSPGIGNGELALIVLVSAFVISGAFLLSGASFLTHPDASVPDPVPVPGPTPASNPAPEPDPRPEPDPLPPNAPPTVLRIPYEREGTTYFLPAADVAALRAEGHYTIAYTATGRVFCPWSISEAEKRLSDATFFRAHRSYLINTAHVTGFERRKDNGVCYFETCAHLDKVPVARSRVSELRAVLGL